MAKAKKKPRDKSIKPKTAEHIRALGLASKEDYFAWCQDNGFERSVDKPPADRAEELEVVKRAAKRAKERQQIHHNPRKFLKRACDGDINPEDINRPGWSEVCSAIAASKPAREYRASLADFLVRIERKSDFLFENVSYGGHTMHYIDGVIRLHDRKGEWIRKFEDWRPESHNVRRQFASLSRHLLAKYPVPTFMDSAWMRRDGGSYRFRDWFIHIGAGENIRTAKLLFPMTSKMAHHFLSAPDNYAIEEALIWGEVHALGGQRRLTDAILGSRLGQQLEIDPDRRAFWTSVYRFFITNPMLDRRHVGPIVDYLYFQKFEQQEVVIGPGQVEIRPPPQPNLSMNRRVPESLLRQVERWHGDQQIFKHASKHYFRRSGYSGITLETGPASSSGKKTQWRIRELLSGSELIEEGRQMRHCVASYTQSCTEGRCSIWTLESRHSSGKLEKHLTLELSKTGVLAQARGRHNRPPNAQESAVLDAWVQHADLNPAYSPTPLP